MAEAEVAQHHLAATDVEHGDIVDEVVRRVDRDRRHEVRRPVVSRFAQLRDDRRALLVPQGGEVGGAAPRPPDRGGPERSVAEAVVVVDVGVDHRPRVRRQAADGGDQIRRLAEVRAGVDHEAGAVAHHQPAVEVQLLVPAHEDAGADLLPAGLMGAAAGVGFPTGGVFTSRSASAGRGCPRAVPDALGRPVGDPPRRPGGGARVERVDHRDRGWCVGQRVLTSITDQSARIAGPPASAALPVTHPGSRRGRPVPGEPRPRPSAGLAEGVVHGADGRHQLKGLRRDRPPRTRPRTTRAPGRRSLPPAPAAPARGTPSRRRPGSFRRAATSQARMPSSDSPMGMSIADDRDVRDGEHGSDVGQRQQRHRPAVEQRADPGPAPAVDTQHCHARSLSDSPACASSSAPITRASSSRST